MKQLERAQLKAVKGGEGWLDVPGGIMNLIPNTTLITVTGTNGNQNTNTSTSLLNSLINAIKNKMNNKK
ncbi:hypothetical protein [Xylanibacter ruminicola]|uniref:hypothetical protein n=1 Tax=Xylanibacter ruminicola TaxID=839 RepID=UPI00049207E8|nr:hypothetical protein [Xylanibacter ruminicola]